MKIEKGDNPEANAAYVKAFKNLPNEAGTELRALALSAEQRDGSTLVTALNADIQATDSDANDLRRELIFAAIRISATETERGMIRESFAGRGKPITVALFKEFAKDNPIIRNIKVPTGSGAIGHTTAYMDREAGAIMAFTKDGDAYGIVAAKDFAVTANIRIREITPERKTGGPIGGAFRTKYVAPDGTVTETEVPFDDLRDTRSPQFPNTTGFAPFLAPGKVRSLAGAISSIGQSAPVITGIGGTGPLLTEDGHYVFLRQRKPALTGTGTDARYSAIIPESKRGISVLDIGEPSNPNDELADLRDYMGIGDATPDQPYIALSVLGALAWAPCGPIPGFGNVSFLIYGESGSLKTALASIGLSAQSSENLYLGPGKDVPVQLKMRHLQSTIFGADNALYYLGGTLALVDDLFAGKMTDGQIAQTYVRLSGIADNIATGEGGTRGKPQNSSGQGLASSKFPRSSALFTAEALPDEQGHVSETARLAIVKMQNPVDKIKLSELQEQANRGVFSSAHTSLIASSLPTFDRHRKAYDIANEVVNSWELGGHLRPIEQWKRIVAGLYVVSSRYGELTDSDPRAFGDSAAEEIREAARLQVARSGVRDGHDVTRDPVRLFLRNARLVLKEREEFFAAPEMAQSDYAEPKIPGFPASAFGWRSVGTGVNATWNSPKGTPVGAIIVYQGKGKRPEPGYETRAFLPVAGWLDFYKAVSRYTVTNDGWPLPSPDSMIELLHKAGYALSTEPAKAKAFGSSSYGYSLRILAILRGEMPGDEPEGDDGDEPDEPEGGTVPANEALTLPGTEPAPEQATGLERDGKGSGKASRDSGPKDTRNAGALAIAPNGNGLAVYFPGADRGPFTVANPASLADVYQIARKYTLTELWIHPNAMKASGIPSVKTFDDAHSTTKGDLSPFAPVASKWANLPDDLATEHRLRGKVSPWIPVWREVVGREGSEVVISVPAYDTRHSFADAKNGQELADAVYLFNEALPKGIRYRWSPNATMKYVAKKIAPKFGNPVHMMTEGEPGPWSHFARMLGLDWSRKPDAGEVRSGVLTMDRNAAELAGFGTDYIGNGEPEHLDGPVTFTRGTAGYYRLAEQVSGYDERLPELYIRGDMNGELWITGPDAELLDELGILPDIAEAWVWPDSGRYMYPMYEVLRKGREYLESAKDSSGGKIAKSSFSQAWHSFIGSLNKNEGAYNADDYSFRPDIRDALQAETYARMYRSLNGIAKTSGRYPIASHADAVSYPANGPEDVPEGMKTDSRVGSYKTEGYKEGSK